MGGLIECSNVSPTLNINRMVDVGSIPTYLQGLQIAAAHRGAVNIFGTYRQKKMIVVATQIIYFKTDKT